MPLGPTATEIAIYAVETKVMVHVLWGLLVVVGIVLVCVSVMHVLVRVQLKAQLAREARLEGEIAGLQADVGGLEARLAKATEAARDPTARNPGKDATLQELKTEVRRLAAIRTKTEQRLVEQNAEVGALRIRVTEQEEEIAVLRQLVAHAQAFEVEPTPMLRSVA